MLLCLPEFFKYLRLRTETTQVEHVMAVASNYGYLTLLQVLPHFIEYSAHFLKKNDDEILAAHYTWKVVVKGPNIKY
jgi:hypothetical protein